MITDHHWRAIFRLDYWILETAPLPGGFYFDIGGLPGHARFLYKAKEWKLIGDLVYNQGQPDEDTVSVNDALIAFVVRTKELELLYLPPTYSAGNTYTLVLTGSTGLQWNFEFQLEQFPHYNTGPLKFYTRIDFRFRVIDPLASPSDPALLFVENFEPGGGFDGTAAFNIDGFPMTIWYSGPFPHTNTLTITSPLTQTITSFWPWAASDGSPIYDTTTGAQLQDPLN